MHSSIMNSMSKHGNSNTASSIRSSSELSAAEQQQQHGRPPQGGKPWPEHIEEKKVEQVTEEERGGETYRRSR
jgi:hypothetical protein